MVVQLLVNQAVLKIEERGNTVHKPTGQRASARRRDNMREPFKIDTGQISKFGMICEAIRSSGTNNEHAAENLNLEQNS